MHAGACPGCGAPSCRHAAAGRAGGCAGAGGGWPGALMRRRWSRSCAEVNKLPAVDYLVLNAGAISDCASVVLDGGHRSEQQVMSMCIPHASGKWHDLARRSPHGSAVARRDGCARPPAHGRWLRAADGDKPPGPLPGRPPLLRPAGASFLLCACCPGLRDALQTGSVDRVSPPGPLPCELLLQSASIDAWRQREARAADRSAHSLSAVQLLRLLLPKLRKQKQASRVVVVAS